MIEAYGQTECCGISTFSHGDDPRNDHVGGPSSGAEICLMDIPEMGYLSTDKDENGNP